MSEIRLWLRIMFWPWLVYRKVRTARCGPQVAK